MRKGGAKSGQQERPVPPPPPPPPPPRTEGAKKRAEASFGAKKNGYYPRSNTPGDEPPVLNNNYSSRVNTERPQPIPDPLAQFKQPKSRSQESFADYRQASPYTSSGGEKTNPFDSTPLNRAKSAKEPPRPEESSIPAVDPPTPKRRSSSMPRKESDDGWRRAKDERPRVVPVPPSSRPIRRRTEASVFGNTFLDADIPTSPSSASESASPPPSQTRESSALLPPGLEATADLVTSGVNNPPPPANARPEGPSMYATPQKDKPSSYSAYDDDPFHIFTPPHHTSAEVGSQGKKASKNLSPFEQSQYHLLKGLIINHENPALPKSKKSSHNTDNQETPVKKQSANRHLPTSFSFNLDDDTFAPKPSGTGPFRKSTSADGINTTFVKDEASATWQFSAGSGDNDSLPQPRSQSHGKATRRSPIKRRPVPNAEAPEAGAQAAQPQTGFDAESWSTKFGPQTFFPRPVTPNLSGSPTRSGRANSRKPRTTKASSGHAATVEDGGSEGDLYDWRGRSSHPKAATVDSPQAMDIDSPMVSSPSVKDIPAWPPLVPTPAPTASAAVPPPPAAPSPLSQPQQQAQAPPQPQPQAQPQAPPMVARNIPVEPSRPEWRPGNVTGLSQVSEGPEEKKEMPVHFQGSEDSEEFRATLDDLKHVAPFAPRNVGLKSLDDLVDNLPFESKASTELHLDVPHAHPLVFPEPPAAPKLPPTVAVDGIKPNVASWSKYLEEFEGYLRRWDLFNAQVVDHFATRKSNIAHARASKGYSFLGARGDSDVLEYHKWIEQDNGVRQRWQAACEEHEVRFREFMAFREKMK